MSSPTTATTLRRSRGAAGSRPSGRRNSALAAPVLAALVLAGCGGGPTSVVSAGSTSVQPSAQTSDPAEPTGESAVDQASDAPQQGTMSAPAGPADDGTADHPSDGPEPGDDGSDGGVPGGGTEGLPGWPIESTPAHGARLWAAYLAVGAPGDPTLQPVLDEVRELWPGAGLGELGCDDGAADALGRDGTEHAVAVYFATEQHVSEFRRRWDGPFVGAAQVTIYCAD